MHVELQFTVQLTCRPKYGFSRCRTSAQALWKFTWPREEYAHVRYCQVGLATLRELNQPTVNVSLAQTVRLFGHLAQVCVYSCCVHKKKRLSVFANRVVCRPMLCWFCRLRQTQGNKRHLCMVFACNLKAARRFTRVMENHRILFRRNLTLIR